MNLKFPKIKKTFRKGGLHTNPDVYWDIMQAAAFILVVSSFIFGFYLFRKIDREFITINDDSNSQIKLIGKERIDKILQYFADKEKNSNEILNSPSPIIDPSK
ncbi:MAG: hypothetical protein V4486_00480 [Patescibacteria group bacterium]